MFSADGVCFLDNERIGWVTVLADIRFDIDGETDLRTVTMVSDMYIIVNAKCKMVYRKCKERDWDSMIRHKFRLRMSANPLGDDIKEILNQPDLTVGKELARFERKNVILFLNIEILPKTCINNIIIIIICNELGIHNEDLQAITPSTLQDKCREFVAKTE